MPKPKFKFIPIGNKPTPDNPRGSGRHFYATSVGEWRKDSDLEALLSFMKSGGMPFTIWTIPAPLDVTYTIKAFTPQIEGAVLLGRFDYNEEA